MAWSNGGAEPADTIIWCTGFRTALRNLAPLRLRDRDGHMPSGGPAGTQALGEPRLFLASYGNWTGPAWATLLGVGRTVHVRSA